MYVFRGMNLKLVSLKKLSLKRKKKFFLFVCFLFQNQVSSSLSVKFEIRALRKKTGT